MIGLNIVTNAEVFGEALDKKALMFDPTYKPFETLLLEIGEFAVDAIQTRTGKGIDKNEAPFKPYDPRYAKWKREYGEKRLVNHPNLVLTGPMMDSVLPRVDLTNSSVIVGAGAGNLTEHADLMEKNIAMGRDPMGITKRDRQDIKEAVGEYVREQLNANA